MLKYKALYKKMMDDLKDAGMWIDWGEKMMEEYPEEGDFLLKSAMYRLETSYPETKIVFERLCEKDAKNDGHCMNELIEEQLEEWHADLCTKLKKVMHKK